MSWSASRRMSVAMPSPFASRLLRVFPIDARRQRGLHPALTVKQQKSVGAAALAVPDSPPLDVLRLEQFLALQQTLLAVAGDADALPARLAQAVAVLLRLDRTAGRGVEDGPPPPLP